MVIGTQKIWTRPNGHTYQTHCQNGHEFNEVNTYLSPKSQKRSCRLCNTQGIKDRYALDPDGTKEKQRNHMRAWRAANKERDRKNWTDLRKQKKEWLDAVRSQGCSRCSESDAACIDFHHRDPSQKLVNLSEAIARWSISRLQKEVDKCDLLCSNCHRKLHAERRVTISS